MNDIEKIKAKIDRLYDGEVPKHDQQCDFGDGYFRGIATIENFIDSLPEEKPSEELEEAAEHCVWNSIDSNDPTLVPKFIPLLLSLFISGAYWQKDQMMKDLEEDVLLLERAWLTLDHLGHEELAERLKTFKEKYANKM